MKTKLQNPPQGTLRDWIDHRACKKPSQQAYRFCDGSSPITWRELRVGAKSLAERLTAIGVAKSSSIAIMHQNGSESVQSLFGVLYGGFRATLINLLAGDDAIRYALEHCEANIAIVGSTESELFERVRPKSIDVLPLTTDTETIDLHSLSPADDALLMYTSGTTGKPKGVVHSHESLLAGGWIPTISHHLTPSDCGLCVLPIYHINGLCVTVLSTLVSGGCLAIAEKFSVSKFWEQCEVEKITWFSVVPTIISHLLNSEIMPKPETLARMRFGRSASAALAPSVQSAFEARFGIPIIETMGLTETAAQILSNPLSPGVRKIGSSGIPFGNKACIMSPNMEPLPAGVQGEIAVMGPNIMREYFKNPAATKKTFTSTGWLRTGDLGYVDEDGYYFVTGRLKELIIKGGENIAPREIDDALYSHADVIEAAAFAYPCEVYGERVEAAVKLKKGSALNEQKLISICWDKVGKFKSPDCIYILEELPKGPSGKIQRLQLSSMIHAEG